MCSLPFYIFHALLFFHDLRFCILLDTLNTVHAAGLSFVIVHPVSKQRISLWCINSNPFYGFLLAHYPSPFLSAFFFLLYTLPCSSSTKTPCRSRAPISYLHHCMVISVPSMIIALRMKALSNYSESHILSMKAIISSSEVSQLR